MNRDPFEYQGEDHWIRKNLCGWIKNFFGFIFGILIYFFIKQATGFTILKLLLTVLFVILFIIVATVADGLLQMAGYDTDIIKFCYKNETKKEENEEENENEEVPPV